MQRLWRILMSGRPRALTCCSCATVTSVCAEAAQQLLERAIAVAPQDPHGWSQLLKLHMDFPHLQAPVPDVATRALKTCPHHPYLLHIWAAWNQGAGELEAAEKLLLQLREIDPDNSRACLSLGIVAQQQGDWAAAARWFRTGTGCGRWAERQLNADELANLAVLEGQPHVCASPAFA